MGLYVKIKKDFGSFLLDTEFEADTEVMGILGESGCGKSMTLRCIAGVVTPDEGRIELDGTVFFDSEKKINLKPQERHVGLLFQNYALFPNMNVVQNLRAALRGQKLGKEEQLVAMSTGIIENDQVRILTGPLQGMEGYIRKINRHKRKAWVSIEMFGRSVDMEVGLEIVKKV